MIQSPTSQISDATLGRIARMLLINYGRKGSFKADLPSTAEGTGVARKLREMGHDVKEADGGRTLMVVCRN